MAFYLVHINMQMLIMLGVAEIGACHKEVQQMKNIVEVYRVRWLFGFAFAAI